MNSSRPIKDGIDATHVRVIHPGTLAWCCGDDIIECDRALGRGPDITRWGSRGATNRVVPRNQRR